MVAYHSSPVMRRISLVVMFCRKSSVISRFLAVATIVLLLGTATTYAVGGDSYLCSANDADAFPLVSESKATALWVSPSDHKGLRRVAKMFQEDVKRVTGKTPEILAGDAPQGDVVVIIGSLGNCPVLDKLVANGKIDASEVEGRWEATITQVVEKPIEGVDRALVIAGSDKRGAVYGLFDLSQQIGVSPWVWWADVPVKQQSELYIAPGPHVSKGPAVKYRGIFINDEAPALANWAAEKFGGCNAKFYDHVFQLILRLKGNYLWPAMWGRAIYDDDPNSPPLADEYGVVIGTTHHEPLMRAHVEWERYGEGPWNYDKNPEKLREFWREGIERMNGYESIITVGMRGDGDEPMSESANIELLQRIVADQREIIEEVTGQPADSLPQIWALYKEVQEYYDKGMRVPEDITLLLCDDNWGNIRKLPRPGSPRHKGGYGIYYHFDYVGDPRNYKWINTNPLPRIWEQMNLAYRHGVTQMWIVNVGDIKPMELPIEFFLDLAWDPDRWPAEQIAEYQRLWAAREFGEAHAAEIGEIVGQYAKINSRRKPELLDADTYNVVNFREAENVVAEYQALADAAQRINDSLPPEYRSAFFQLVLHPVLASANLHDLYVTVAKNRLYAEQRRAETNALAERARQLYARDSEITDRYHKLNDGKWNHMMSQNHIGYTYWQEPRRQVMPEVREIEIPTAGEMGVAIEDSTSWWPQAEGEAVLPEMVVGGSSRYIDVFNRGKQTFDFTASSAEPWLTVEPASGQVSEQVRLEVSVDWSALPEGVDSVPVTITSSTGQEVVIQALVNHTGLDSPEEGAWIENDGYVSIDAENFTRSLDAGPLSWQWVPDLGRRSGAVMPVPVTAERVSDPTAGPCLEYDVLLHSTGDVLVTAYVSPTLDYYASDGFRYAISIDDDPPQTVNIHADTSHPFWQNNVRTNINKSSSKHKISEPGKHVLKLWMVDPGVVVQELVMETGEVRPSYLGPPESPRVPSH